MELKENAVQCYLTTDLTYEAVARKFEITNFTLLASWVNHFKIYGEVPISKKRGWRKKLESIASSMTQNPNDSQRIKELEQELRYAQIEVAYLKGLRRLEKNALMNKNQDSS
ncbi:transposase, partial [Lactococcus cremoris subsp. cremoris TIFN1]